MENANENKPNTKWQWQMDPKYTLYYFLDNPDNQAKLGSAAHPALTTQHDDWKLVEKAADNLSRKILVIYQSLWNDLPFNEMLTHEMAYEMLFRDARACLGKPKRHFDVAHAMCVPAQNLQVPFSHALRRRHPELKDAVVRVAPIWAGIFNDVCKNMEALHISSSEDGLIYYREAWDGMVRATTDKNKLLPLSDGTILVWDKSTKTLHESAEKAYRQKGAPFYGDYERRIPQSAQKRGNLELVNGFDFFIAQFDEFFPIDFLDFARRRAQDPMKATRIS